MYARSIAVKKRNIVVIVIIALLGIIEMLITYRLPIAREEARELSGSFVMYDERNNELYIGDGEGDCYFTNDLYIDDAFIEAVKALRVGEPIYITVDDFGNILEIKTDSTEILNFDRSQELMRIDIAAVVSGAFLFALAAMLTVITVIGRRYAKREAKKYHARLADFREGSSDSAVLREADADAPEKLYVAASAPELEIRYRRVKNTHTNELIVNGMVYDEIQGRLEFGHRLIAFVGGHVIEAVFDGIDSRVYVALDGREIGSRRRWL